MRRNSKNATISQLVRQSTMQELRKVQQQNGREYRLITGGDDGLIIWWNVHYSPDKPADPTTSQIVYVDERAITHLKSVHEIHLSAQAQMYCIMVGHNILVVCQNDGILSYYTCKYGSIEDEDKQTEQAQEEAKKEETAK